jgi:uncharacterized protein (TIGR03435 family)
MMRAAGRLSVLFCASSWVFGQTFEVASIKPAPPPTGGMILVMMSGGPGSADPGRVTFTNMTVKNILMRAYEVKSYQISGPGWLDSERFDIVAKVPQGATKEQFALMIQNLLAERFKLTLHHEKKDLPMYALVVAKNGPKLKESVDDRNAKDAGSAPPLGPPPPPGPMGKDGFPQLPPGAGGRGILMMGMNGRARISGTKRSMAELADGLAGFLDRPVVDMTELKANYDFTLYFDPEGMMGLMGPIGRGGPGGPGEGGAPVTSAPESVSIFTAVQEQLGLKLDQRKGPVDLLVIDHLEKVSTDN